MIVQEYIGDDWEWTVSMTQNGIPVDWTGWSLYFTLKSRLEDTDAQALIKVKKVLITNPETLVISHTQTKTLSESLYWAEFKLVDLDGKIKTQVFQIQAVKPVLREIWN